MLRFFVFLSLLVLTSCQPCYVNYCREGAPEFVMDSYRIKEGKFSILELEGEQICPLPCAYLQEYEDVIDEDDVLRIAIYHPTREDLITAVSSIGSLVGYRVQCGQIQLPGLDPVIIKGLTLTEAKNKIQKFYDKELNDIKVFIEYETRLHSNVELSGAVEISHVPVNGRIRLYEVLSNAGVPPGANLFKSYVSRGGILLPIDLYQLIHKGDMSQNIVMRPKDKIFIADPMESTVMVMGEVGYAQVIPVPHGSISLREAIAIAGGIPFTGDKRCIQVIRGNIINPKIYRLSWNHILHLPNDSLLLMPGDTVYISEKPITKWNRFIDQLLPSSLLIDLGIKTRGLFH
ncbi:MAG: polysaccharide biosynthesis/export family protein [Chlamydiia bacterium]|nr:polysaccharide biosynthesis/export family protein [Chlamydiia bacterium]